MDRVKLANRWSLCQHRSRPALMKGSRLDTDAESTFYYNTHQHISPLKPSHPYTIRSIYFHTQKHLIFASDSNDLLLEDSFHFQNKWRSKQPCNILFLHTSRFQSSVNLQFTLLDRLGRTLKTKPANGVLNFRYGVGKEVDIVIANGGSVPPIDLSIWVVGTLPLHPHLRHNLILDSVALHDVVQLCLFSNRFFVFMPFPLEAGSHTEDPVATLTAKVLPCVDTCLGDTGGLFEEVQHAFAGEGQPVLDGLAHFRLPEPLECSREGHLELGMLLSGVCVEGEIRFLNRRRSSRWQSERTSLTTFMYLVGSAISECNNYINKVVALLPLSPYIPLTSSVLLEIQSNPNIQRSCVCAKKQTQTRNTTSSKNFLSPSELSPGRCTKAVGLDLIFLSRWARCSLRQEIRFSSSKVVAMRYFCSLGMARMPRTQQNNAKESLRCVNMAGSMRVYTSFCRQDSQMRSK